MCRERVKEGNGQIRQEYESPLLVMTGAEYGAMPLQVLHDRLCTALRGDRPRLVLEVIGRDGATTLVFDDGSRTSGRRSRK